MKSELLESITDLKKKNIELKNEILNDYKVYQDLANDPSYIYITLTDNSFSVHDGDFIVDKEVLNSYMLRIILHNYLSKSIIKGKHAYRYDVFVFNDMNGEKCTKYAHLEEKVKTTSQRGIVKCSNKELASIIRDELEDTFGYVSYNEVMEKILHIGG